MTDVFVHSAYVNSAKASFKYATLNLVCHELNASIMKSLQQSCQNIENEVQRAKLATAINNVTILQWQNYTVTLLHQPVS
jgi:hypothetical protein